MRITSFIIWACIPSVFKIHYSLLSAIPMSFLICWIGNIYEERRRVKSRFDDLYLENETLKLSLKPKQFDVNSCTEEELIARCKELGFSQALTELSVEFFILKTKQSILADKYCIEENSVAKQKYRLKHKLNCPQ